MRKPHPLIDRHHGDAGVTNVNAHAGGAACAVEGEDGLGGHIETGHAQSLEEESCEPLAVHRRTKGRVGDDDSLIFWCHTTLVVHGVAEEVFRVVPVVKQTTLDGSTECEYTALRLGFVADIHVFLRHTDHHAGMPAAAHF